MEWTQGNYTANDDKSQLDMYYVMPALQKSYWALDRPKEVIEQSIRNSVTLGVYTEGRQIGFARAVTDKCTFAWICDIMIHPDYRGVGLGKFIVECLSEHPEVAACEDHFLRTDDAHGLYEQFGYKVCEAMVKKNGV
ncbi:MAG: GNAT family N-acetyltransferase [bacterium]|nr:GNAT family N-acetyltransferase [bacterium]